MLVSVTVVVIAIPIIVVTALGSALALRAWPFFVQERVGEGGRPFRLVKVRTLPTSCPSYTDKHNLDAVHIPAFCRLLRRLHLDELPQLIHVLWGHMSLVGPRPEMRHLHEQMDPAFARTRTSTRPGCTGLWQISVARSDLISMAPEYDRFYLTHRSLRLDLWVMLRTAATMLGIAPPATLEDVPQWALRTEGVRRLRLIDLRDSVDSQASVNRHDVADHRYLLAPNTDQRTNQPQSVSATSG